MFVLHFGTACFIVALVALISKLFLFSRLDLFYWYKLKFNPQFIRIPLIMKNRTNCQKVYFDSTKEASWRTECNATNHSFLQSEISEKSRKTSNNYYFWPKPLKMVIVGGSSCFCSDTLFCKELGFFVLFSVHQDASFVLSNFFWQSYLFFIIRVDSCD